VGSVGVRNVEREHSILAMRSHFRSQLRRHRLGQKLQTRLERSDLETRKIFFLKKKKKKRHKRNACFCTNLIQGSSVLIVQHSIFSLQKCNRPSQRSNLPKKKLTKTPRLSLGSLTFCNNRGRCDASEFMTCFSQSLRNISIPQMSQLTRTPGQLWL
jgi:hypothetical protein